MKVLLKVEREFDIRKLKVTAKVRYWEDATVNGTEDADGTLIPLRDGDNWCPIINIESGLIENWPEGVKAEIHYKVCDQCECELIDRDYNKVLTHEGYVPSSLCPVKNGYGDYIIMNIDGDGKIEGWEFNVADFTNED